MICLIVFLQGLSVGFVSRINEKYCDFDIGTGGIPSACQKNGKDNGNSQRSPGRAMDIGHYADQSDVCGGLFRREKVFQRGTRSHAVGLSAVHRQCWKTLVVKVRCPFFPLPCVMIEQDCPVFAPGTLRWCQNCKLVSSNWLRCGQTPRRWLFRRNWPRWKGWGFFYRVTGGIPSHWSETFEVKLENSISWKRNFF